MTLSAVIAAGRRDSAGQPAALAPVGHDTVVGRLVRQLECLGATDVTIWAGPQHDEALAAQVGPSARVVAAADLFAVAADREMPPGSSLLLLDGDIVVHDSALRNLVDDPRFGTAALVALSSSCGSDEVAVEVVDDLVVDVATTSTGAGPGGRFLGALRLDGAAVAALRERVPEMRALDSPDAVAVALTAVVRSAVAVRAVDLRRLFWARATEPDAAARAASAIERLDEDRLQMHSAVKAEDGVFGTFFVSPYSRFVARWAGRAGLSPNVVTVASLLLAIGAAGLFALGHQPERVAGSLVLFVAFVLDCVDGQLARYTRRFTAFGAWFDATTDRVKEYAVYAGLAAGSVRIGADNLWTLAGIAMAVQSVRHLLDYAYPASRLRPLGRRPLDAPAATTPRTGRLPAWTRYPRRFVTLPIGERFAVICLTAAVFSARTTFVTLLSWGLVAALYGNVGRIRRSFA